MKIGDRQFLKNLVFLAIPISLQNLITFAVGFADNLMIGRLGDDAVSGVYMGNQMQTVFQLFMTGVEGAILILAAQYWGKKDTESIKKIVAIGVRFGLGLAVVFSFIAIFFPSSVIRIFTTDAGVIETGTAYLQMLSVSFIFFAISQSMIATMRSVEITKIGLYVSVMALIINVGLNYIFIFGVGDIIPAMGVQGAALGTLISRVLEAGFVCYYVRFKDTRLKLRIKDLRKTDKDMFKDFVKYGLPVMGGQIVWGCNLIGNSIILGRFSSEVITATSVTGMLHNLVYVWMTGLSSAVGIITGRTVGEGKIERVKRNAKIVQVLFVCVGLLSGLFVHLIRDSFIGLYNISPEAVSYSQQFINIISVTLIFSCYQAACLFGLVKSGGDISFVFKNDSCFVFLVVLPSAIIASLLGAAPWVVFLCLKCDQIFKCIVAVIKINSYNWIKDLTKKEIVKE